MITVLSSSELPMLSCPAWAGLQDRMLLAVPPSKIRNILNKIHWTNMKAKMADKIVCQRIFSFRNCTRKLALDCTLCVFPSAWKRCSYRDRRSLSIFEDLSGLASPWKFAWIMHNFRTNTIFGSLPSLLSTLSFALCYCLLSASWEPGGKEGADNVGCHT